SSGRLATGSCSSRRATTIRTRLCSRSTGSSATCRPAAASSTRRQSEIAEREAVAFDGWPQLDGQRSREDRAGVDERVELAVLAARVDMLREIREQCAVVVASGESPVEHARVDAHQNGLEACPDELVRERRRVSAPQRKHRLPSDPGEPLLAVGTDVFEVEVAERERLDLG